MSIEVTPESLRTHAAWLKEQGADAAHSLLLGWAARAEAEQSPPLPTVPGWYPGVVVERGGESCTGALLTPDCLWWCTPKFLDDNFLHRNSDETTIRWAEQDGTTPGQTAYKAAVGGRNDTHWGRECTADRNVWERTAAAVLAVHGTPTLTPVGEHPEPGTRGLLPVVLDEADEWNYDGTFNYLCDVESELGRTILADPRPDGAHE